MNGSLRYFVGSIMTAFLLLPFTPSVAQQETLYPTLATGTVAYPVSGKNEAGKTSSLKKIKSRYTLLYFYQVNCHLCEVVTPELKKLYEAYHKIGLEVVAIPVDSDKGEWKSYVKEKGLIWKNIFLSTATLEKLRRDYKLTVYPTIYLLDKKKVLLTERMMRPEEVERVLNERIR